MPLDFFSWHAYPRDPNWLFELEADIRKSLNEYGYTETESILSEYNYLEGWTDKFVSSIKAITGIRGAAFNAAFMSVGQKSSVDMLMYYDARIDTCFNGMFDFYTLKPLKGYYPFLMFSQLYELENCVNACSDDTNIYVTAAKGKDRYSFMLTHFRSDKNEKNTTSVTISLPDDLDGEWQLELLDRDNTMLKKQIIVKDGIATIEMTENSVVLISK